MQASGLSKLIVRDLGLSNYPKVWREMQGFTDSREAHTPDELWLTEHQPIYTLGQAGKLDHLTKPGNIPVLSTDRGGQVTYHGPGQLVVYPLLDIKRLGLGVRGLVTTIENSVLALLEKYRVKGEVAAKAPGVYVSGKKIASLGLRVRRGCSFHGLAINVAMDLAPFEGINPCGFEGMKMTQVRDVVSSEENISVSEIADQYKLILAGALGLSLS